MVQGKISAGTPAGAIPLKSMANQAGSEADCREFHLEDVATPAVTSYNSSIKMSQTLSIGNVRVPWNRFWCTPDSTIHLEEGDRGLLTDPESELGKHLNPNVFRLPEIIPTVGPLILWGEPGIGKSTELLNLKHLVEQSQNKETDKLISFHFRDISDLSSFRNRTIENPVWRDWSAGLGHLTLVVDGVDEGLLRIPNFISDLASMLSDAPLQRLRVILTCRSAEWPIELGNRLVSLWSIPDQKHIFELCPLRYADVAEFAEARLPHPTAFLDQIATKRVTALASRPITLLFLLNEFLNNKGHLPTTHHQLYERVTKNLVREIDPQRAELLRAITKTGSRASESQRLIAAQRLAAMLLLTGKSGVTRGDVAFESETSSDLRIEECYDSTSHTPSEATSTALQEAMETALFTSRGGGRHGFIHQTVAECLGAQHLANLPLVQLRSLLCARDQRAEHVVPQLAELASWVASYSQPFCDHILNIEPEILLRSDTTRQSTKLRQRLVDAIVSRAIEGRTFDDIGFRRLLSSLRHPNIAEQLRPVITDRSVNPVARRIAISMAGECKISSLSDDLLAIVKSSDENQHIRERSLRTLVDVMPRERFSEIEPFAEDPNDPNDNLRAYALEAMLTSGHKIKKLLQYIRPHKRSGYYGAYHRLLRSLLPLHLDQDDVLPILDWLHDQHGIFHSSGSRYEFAIRAVRMALPRIIDDSIRNSLTQLWILHSTCNPDAQLPNDKDIKATLNDNTAIRQTLAKNILNHPQCQPEKVFNILIVPGLIVSPDDLGWLLDELRDCCPPNRTNWAEAISYCITPQDMIPHGQIFLDLVATVPELSNRFKWLAPWDLDDPDVRKKKAYWLRNQRRSQAIKKHINAKKERSQSATASVDAIIGPDTWFRAWLSITQNSTDYTIDLTKHPRWHALTDLEKQHFREAAAFHIRHHATNHSKWQPHSPIYFSTRCAIWLIRDLVKDDFDMQKIIKDSWITFCGEPFYADSDSEAEWFSYLYSIDHTASMAALMEAATSDAKRAGHIFAFRAARLCWDHEISTATHSFIDRIKAEYPHRVIISGIEEWASMDKEPAAQFALDLIKTNLPTNDEYPICIKQAIVTGMLLAPVQTLAIASSALNDDYLARAVWTEVISAIETSSTPWFDHIPDSSLVDLYLDLIRLFPTAEDPPFESGEIPPRRSVAEGRDRIPSILGERATESSCGELLKLAALLPNERTRFLWIHKNSLQNLRQKMWIPCSTTHLLATLANKNSRLVNCELDLVSLTLESLARLQVHLTDQELPSVEELWSWDGNGQKRSNFRPKDEEAISDSIARWLKDDIGPAAGIIVNREVQPRRGSRTDITLNATTPSATENFRPLTLVIEVKGCWHPDVKSAMHTQLVEGYLRPNGLQAGIFVVGWFVCDRWKESTNKTGCRTIEEADTFFGAEASRYDGSNEAEKVVAAILDCRINVNSPSKR